MLLLSPYYSAHSIMHAGVASTQTIAFTLAQASSSAAGASSNAANSGAVLVSIAAWLCSSAWMLLSHVIVSQAAKEAAAVSAALAQAGVRLIMHGSM